MKTRPYYAPDVAARHCRMSEELDKIAVDTLPRELLPESLLPERDGQGGSVSATDDPAGSGTGGWTAFSKMFEPSADPNITYEVYGSEMDTSGRSCDLFAVRTKTDVSQPPDAANFQTRDVARLYCATYAEGSWSAPVMVAPATGQQDSSPVMFEFDDDGYLHLVYTRWTWGRDASMPAGDPYAYSHFNENLVYRYRAPDGTWSEPRVLTSFAGAWAIQGGDCHIDNGRIHCSWLAVFDKQTWPVQTFRARVMYAQGIRNSWVTPNTLYQWDYSNAAGQELPNWSPNIGVSPVTGEVLLTYSTFVPGAGPAQDRMKAYGLVRSPAGSWSSRRDLTPSNPNEYWQGAYPNYGRDGLTATLMLFEGKMDTSAPALVPESNIYLLRHEPDGWKSLVNATRLPAGQVIEDFDISIDPWDRWNFAVSSSAVVWDAGLTQWRPVGGRLRYTRETETGFSPYEDVLGYQAGRFIVYVWSQLDPDGRSRVAFLTAQGVGMTDQKVYYSDNRQGGFSTPTKLSADSNQQVDWVWLSLTPVGETVVGWFEYRFGSGDRPLAGAIYSRTLSGTTWSPLRNVTRPASGDIVHVVRLTYYDDLYYDIEWTDTGEQQCVYETARYNTATHTYFGFKKYYNETVNGLWGAPQLLSDTAVSAAPYYLFPDANGRMHATFQHDDGAGKETLYSTMQRKPTPPATTYFFAEGTTRPGFQEWLCLQNPADSAANVKITYMLGTGENKEQQVTVAAHSRLTVDVNLFVGPGQDVSALVASDRLIVAERLMYFTYGAAGWAGGSDALGSAETARVWYFAEGTTRSEFAQYLTLHNPSAYDATVKVTYMLGDGSTSEQDVPVAAKSRATVDVKAAVGEGKDVSMKVESPDAGIVAERPMYFNYKNQGWTGGHNSMGSTKLESRWYFAEGTTRGGFDTYLCIQNPNASAGTANITYIRGDGSTSTKTLALPATSRQTVRVNDDIGAEKDVSIVLDATLPVLAERPMYFDYHGIAPGGHVAMGAALPKNSWFFAEGTTRTGFDEWLSLENPGPLAATATLSYMMGDGSVVEQAVPVPAHTRVTVDVPLAVGRGKDVSVAVWSDEGIIAERPMYFVPTPDTPTIQPGGTDVLGL